MGLHCGFHGASAAEVVFGRLPPPVVVGNAVEAVHGWSPSGKGTSLLVGIPILATKLPPVGGRSPFSPENPFRLRYEGIHRDGQLTERMALRE